MSNSACCNDMATAKLSSASTTGTCVAMPRRTPVKLENALDMPTNRRATDRRRCFVWAPDTTIPEGAGHVAAGLQGAA